MHLIFMARGINDCFEKWKMFMQTQMFQWERQPLLKDKDGNFLKDKDGNFLRGEPEFQSVGGALRPIQLFEYVFPEESPVFQNGKKIGTINNLPVILALMNNSHQSCDNQRPEIQAHAWMLRKLMNLKKIPPIPEEIKKLDKSQITSKFIYGQGMAFYPIGVKEDVIQDYPNYGYYQEGL